MRSACDSLWGFSAARASAHSGDRSFTMETYFVTTAIPYVNARPHIGHALEFIQTDVVARYQRQLGKDVFFLSGADENSLKNVRAAEDEGIPTIELVDRNTKFFTDVLDVLEISNDDFLRTVSERHHRGVQKLWSACRPEDIYKKSYKGLYCVGCETFYNPSELVDGKCPEHKTAPEEIEEENYFFKLSNYEKQLEELIASDTYKILPESRKNEVLSFIRGGLQDFSISRSQARARGWGVTVPGDDSQVVYVWYDALGNYITALDYDQPDAGTNPENKFTKYWPCNLHCIGKGIIRFHAVYWPAMLLSAGLPLPKSLFVHGYVTLNGEKISKTLGNAIDPIEFVEKYGVEPLRYYLLRHIHPFQDGDVDTGKLETAYNAELANGIGNLTSRTLAMIAKYLDSKTPAPAGASEQAQAVRAKLESVFETHARLMAGCEFQQALANIWEGITVIDGYITHTRPFEIAKHAERRAELEEILFVCAEGVRLIAALLFPFLPKTATEIWRRLGLDPAPLSTRGIELARWGLLATGATVEKGDPLFKRLEDPAKS